MSEFECLLGKDTNNICRTCLMAGDLIPIFEDCKFPQECVAEMLATCTLIDCCEKDALPKYVCSECLQEIHSSYSFARKCEKSDKILRRYITRKTRQTKSRENEVFFEEDNIITTGCTEEANLEPIEQNESIISQDIIEENCLTNSQEFSSEINLSNDRSIILNYDDVMFNQTEIMVGHDYKFEDTVQNNIQIDSEEQIIPEEYIDYDINTEFIQINNSELNLQHINEVEVIEPSSKLHECQKCVKSFSTFRQLKEHKKTVEHFQTCNIKIKCQICTKSISYQYYKKHLNSHSNEIDLTCTTCGLQFRYVKNLEKHILLQHNNKIKCIECNLEFSTTSSYKEHTKKHTQTCKFCQKTFQTKSGLKQHLLIHGDKKYLCSFCGKGATTLSTLSVHVKTHTGVRNHKCPICNKSFTQSSTLKVHMLLHSGIKPHSCEICNKRFTQRHHLKYHMLQHTREKNYSCKICQKKFSYSGTLKVHMRKHTGQTPYSCSICGKRFYDSSSMKKHEKTHLS